MARRPTIYDAMTFPEYRHRDYPKMVSGPGGRTLVGSAMEERALLQEGKSKAQEEAAAAAKAATAAKPGPSGGAKG